jgi:ABC-type Fe3+ transport system substrate-binding protein
VSWTERAGPFKARLGEFTFTNIATALREKGGWAALAQKPEWGFFKFAHTHPNQSNSGLLTLVLMASDFHNKARGLELADILDPRFQEWMIGLETAVVDLPNSTGNLMRDMVLKGPSTYDVVMVYESVAIDFLKNAEGRWGQLEVSYPRLNLWSDNPYYILDAPGSSAAQRQAGGAFLDFLMTETAQRTALAHGFRPGNPAVAIRFPESPFTLYAKHGLKVDLPSVCERPKAEVLHNLLVGWNNNIRNR